MGGNAFATDGHDGPALDVPRLSPSEYDAIKNRCLSILKEYYQIAVVQPEAPGKTSYGDVDCMVQGHACEDVKQALKQRLDARRVLSCGPTTSYAVPLEGRPDAYAQVDVHECPEEQLQWELFMHSYGDMWQILGMMQRDMGLTANDKGLHLRIAEVEPTDRKGSMIYLTKDPDETMSFLGLDPAAFHAGFPTEEDLFRWCASGHFCTRTVIGQDVRNANDRQRMKKRPMFGRFFNEWMPARPEVGAGDPVPRADVEADAIKVFGRKEEVELLLAKHRATVKEAALWQRIGELLPEERTEKFNFTIRALKRWVQVVDGQFSIRDEADMEHNLQPMLSEKVTETDEPALFEWIQQNWEEIRTREKARVKMLQQQRGRKSEGALDGHGPD